MTNLNPTQARTAWVEALRSGDYRQTIGALRSPRGAKHCCLGVACDLYLKTEGLGGWSDGVFVTKEESTGGVLPTDVRIWLGLSSIGGTLDDNVDSLIGMNDRGESFNTIADMIEQGKVKTNA